MTYRKRARTSVRDRAACLGLGLLPAALTLPAHAQPDAPDPEVTDVMVVTAGRTEQTLASAPAAVTVITAAEIEGNPGDDFGDLLRNVPGLNVSQVSTRDINMTARGATSTLSNSQLVLLDGRSIYLDFFGIVMWDFLPIQSREIEQIEVVRGPGSAVWGANAMTGVVNVIQKRPKDMGGTSVILGSSPSANVLHAGGDDDFAYKVSAGYFEEDAYPRPTGPVPGANPPKTYPDYRNEGTLQKRANAQLEWGQDDGYLSLGFGTAQTDGIMHSGIGPFDIERGAESSYLNADWHVGPMLLRFAATTLDGDAQNMLTRGEDGQPLGFAFNTDTYEVDFSTTSDIGSRHTLAYGGNVRTNDHVLEIAPNAAEKDEWGVYLQDTIALGERWRWVVGARYDDIDPLSDAVFTPRTSLLFSPTESSTIRVSYNEAFRTPSATNSYLDVTILQEVGPLLVPADAVGNPNLVEEHLTAYEIGWVGSVGDAIRLTVDVYRNEIEDSIDFYTAARYGPGNLPTGLPPDVTFCFTQEPTTFPACPNGGLAGAVPSDYSYRNIGGTVNRGMEVGFAQSRGNWGWFANASWQDEPDVEGVPIEEVNLPPEWRANLGVDQDFGRTFWNATVNYQDKSYWSDVLDFRAYTDSFVQLNASFGWRFRDETMSVRIVAQNLTDEDVQQHIFGDIIERRVQGQLTFEF